MYIYFAISVPRLFLNFESKDTRGDKRGYCKRRGNANKVVSRSQRTEKCQVWLTCLENRDFKPCVHVSQWLREAISARLPTHVTRSLHRQDCDTTVLNSTTFFLLLSKPPFKKIYFIITNFSNKFLPPSPVEVSNRRYENVWFPKNFK